MATDSSGVIAPTGNAGVIWQNMLGQISQDAWNAIPDPVKQGIAYFLEDSVTFLLQLPDLSNQQAISWVSQEIVKELGSIPLVGQWASKDALGVWNLIPTWAKDAFFTALRLAVEIFEAAAVGIVGAVSTGVVLLVLVVGGIILLPAIEGLALSVLIGGHKHGKGKGKKRR